MMIDFILVLLVAAVIGLYLRIEFLNGRIDKQTEILRAATQAILRLENERKS